MKVLYISDQLENSDHTSVEAIFNRHIRTHADVVIVYFSKNRTSMESLGNGKIAIPYKYRATVLKEIAKAVNLQDIDVVIVRNYFDVLKEALDLRVRYGFKVGFQLSFPHSYRRYHQAKIERKSLWRKIPEYWYKSFIERKMLDRCDFFIPISSTLAEFVAPNYKKPVFAMGTGVDFDKNIFHDKSSNDGERDVKKFVYIGTVDTLRGLGDILDGFSKVHSQKWQMDIFTNNIELTQSLMEKMPQQTAEKINVCGYIKRDELLRRLSTEYDCGISLIPETQLYLVSSPTKTMEYYACGLPVLMSNLPEHKMLFEGCGFFSSVESDMIAKEVEKIIDKDFVTLVQMGKKGQAIVYEKRNYKRMAADLFSFLDKIIRSDCN